MGSVDSGSKTMQAFPRADHARYGTHPTIAAQEADSTCPYTLKVPPKRGKVRSIIGFVFFGVAKITVSTRFLSHGVERSGHHFLLDVAEWGR